MTPYYEHAGITIYHGDCREILPQIESVDHVITDPPYDERTHAGARTAARVPGSVDRPERPGRKSPSVLQIDFAPLDVIAATPLLLAAARRLIGRASLGAKRSGRTAIGLLVGRAGRRVRQKTPGSTRRKWSSSRRAGTLKRWPSAR